MKRAILFATLALALAVPALAQKGSIGPRSPEEGGRPRRAYANPSAGIAADLERARLTGEKKGRWHALRETAAPDAVMFVPQMVPAQPWLGDRSDVLPGFTLRPFNAWASCDGSLIVTSGARRDGDDAGWYTTVWQRQPDGDFRWVFDHGGPVDDPLTEPEMIEALVADCPATRAKAPARDARAAHKRSKPSPVEFDPAERSGRSSDGSLTWEVTTGPAGAHHFTASMLGNGEMNTFRDEKVVPGGS